MSSAVALGFAVAAVGFGGRYAARLLRQMPKVDTARLMPNLNLNMNLNSYYKGGFEEKMSRREAGLILGVSPSSPYKRIQEAHKRVMIANHPDRGGSPYIAAKINEAKTYLDKVHAQ